MKAAIKVSDCPNVVKVMMSFEAKKNELGPAVDRLLDLKDLQDTDLVFAIIVNYANGGDLSTLDPNKAWYQYIPVKYRYKFALEVARALKCINIDEELLHRDIKP